MTRRASEVRVRTVSEGGVFQQPHTYKTPWIDYRRSVSLAYGLAADLVCDACGCRLCDDNAHSPRCDA